MEVVTFLKSILFICYLVLQTECRQSSIYNLCHMCHHSLIKFNLFQVYNTSDLVWIHFTIQETQCRQAFMCVKFSSYVPCDPANRFEVTNNKPDIQSTKFGLNSWDRGQTSIWSNLTKWPWKQDHGHQNQSPVSPHSNDVSKYIRKSLLPTQIIQVWIHQIRADKHLVKSPRWPWK